MKKLLTYLIASMALSFTFANPPTSIQKNLQWREKPYVHSAEGSESFQIYAFEGAVYNEDHPSLPYFTERFPLSAYSDVQAVFTSAVFEPFEKTPSKDDVVLSGEVNLITNVEKDRRDYFGRVSFIPIRKVGEGRFERLVSFEVRLIYTPLPAPISFRGGNTYTSVLSDGTIYKFAVSETGMYKLDFDFLKNKLGIPLESIDPRTIKLYGNGGGMLPESVDAERYDDLVENTIQIVGEGDGKFDAGDYLLFYGEGADKCYFNETTLTFSQPKNYYDSKNYYFLKISSGNGKRVASQPSITGGTYTSTAFNGYARYEKDISNLLHEWAYGEGSGKQWFGDYFKVLTTKDYSDQFQIPNLLTTAPLKLNATSAGRIKSGSFGRFSITANGTTFTSESFASTGGGTIDTYASVKSIDGEFFANNGQLQIRFDFAKGNDAFNEAWLDFIELNFRRQLLLAGDYMSFRDVETLKHPVSTFRLGNAGSGTIVWDITDLLSPRQVAASSSGSELTFGANTQEALREFVAFNPGGKLLSAEAVGKIDNQNVHATTDVDLVVLYHKEFKSEAERLAQHRRQHSNLAVAAIDVEQLYNEFSSGKKDATAIRDFAKMVFDRSPERFSSLLLFGDGSFDSRNMYKLGGDFIPVYETAQSLSPITAFPSDDFFALLSEGEGGNISSGALDIGVGRFPVKSLAEAQAAVDKIIHYDTNPSTLRDWRNRIAFVGDDEDGNQHTGDADDIAVYVGNKNANLNLDKIYVDAFPQVSTPGGTRVPLATEAINNNVFKGVLAMVYLGHGGVRGWTQERILKIEDIYSWENLDKMPLIITATCSFGGYDNPSLATGGEEAFLNKRGGAIALFTTVRPVYANANAKLTQASVDTLFFKFNHKVPTIGEVLRLSKNKVSLNGSETTNSRKFALLGDPSMQLALPLYSVKTTRVNGHDVAGGIVDTIRALQKVTIEGQVEDDFGKVVTNFKGVVYPTIYDKKITYRTLAQDPGSPLFNFDLQKNVVFKGRASVTNGKFQFTFVVPKDIDYNYGNCKISYYAADETQYVDGAGNHQGVVVGGTDANAAADNRGPKVEVFMNDENFVFGGITSPDPALFVKLQDDNGINVVGNSVGHDLAGILDKNSQNTYILNDFYEAALDDYTRGEVRYPLSKLAEGRHEIKVTAWDIANNPAEGFTEFVVVTSEEMALKHVLNYPNPFTTSTCFMFEHNQAGVELDVLIQIYTVSGRLIKVLEERIISEGNRLGNGNCIRWDGRDDYGDPLAKGVYLYKVKVRSANTGNVTLSGESEFEKLVILK
jgi:hypothetical protein